MSWSVVVPSNRPEQLQAFCDAWGPLFRRHNVNLIVIQDDADGWDFNVPAPTSAISWPAIPEWIPRRTDMIRSWGIYQAWLAGTDYTLTLDDDVRPFGDPFNAYEDVFDRGAPVSPYLNVGALTTFEKPLRGFPFKDREPKEVAVQYGGWHGVLDYDAPTQLEGVKESEWFQRLVLPVPKGVPVTGCIMNAAWRTKYAPIMWQLPMLTKHLWRGPEFGYDGRECGRCGFAQSNVERAGGRDWPPAPPCRGRYNRFGDIWAGLFAKRVCDALDVAMVVNGFASVRHERASDPQKNLERERPGIPVNEGLWDGVVESLAGPHESLLDVYGWVTDKAAIYFERRDPEYATHFRSARDEWVGLFVD